MQSNVQPKGADKPYLSRSAAADYLTEELGVKVARSQLQKLASVGGGPRYRIIGREAYYSRGDLDAWVDSHPAKASACRSPR